MNKEAQRSSEIPVEEIQSFLDELSKFHKEIFARYGLELVPSLEIKSTGIKPTFSVRKFTPVKEVVDKIHEE